MTRLLALTALAVACSACAAQKDKESGPTAGDEAPAFTLKDQDGKERTLADLVKKGKVALVFYRSADW
jgi:cytochrome oxidase Cu insertion factor (SCO1/SenC/PrrC family)